VSSELSGRRIAFVVANEGVEQAELTSPWEAVVQAGGEPVLIAPKADPVQAFKHLDKADTFNVDLTTTEVRVEDFDAVVLPGGVANADELRTDHPAVEFVRGFFTSGRPVASICHGPWSIIEADQAQVCTSGPNTLITSRKPDDLPAFNAKVLEVMRNSYR